MSERLGNLGTGALPWPQEQKTPVPKFDAPRWIALGGWRYLIALGSNVRHHRFGEPGAVLAAALTALADRGVTIERVAPVMRSAPVGPSARRYANGAALVYSSLTPDRLLVLLKQTEARFGRRAGRRWGARVLDLDIILWAGGVWHSGRRSGGARLDVPHGAFRSRLFVLRPALAIAPDWRDPFSGLTIRQLHTRLTRRRPASRAPSRAGRIVWGPLAQSVEQLTFNQ